MTMESKPRPDLRWLFSPLVGLELVSNQSEGNLLFERGVLLSVEDVPQFIDRMNFAKVYPDRVQEAVEEVSWLPYMDERRQQHALVAVQGYGKTDAERNESAWKRAREITSALSVIFLTRSAFRETCCSREQMTRHDTANTVALEESYGLAGMTETITTRAFLIRVPAIATSLDYGQLAAMLSDAPFRGITDVVLKGCDIHSSLKGAISNSTTVLMEFLHSSSPEMQLIGSVTALEILFSIEGAQYDVLKRRARSLMGDKFCQNFGLDEVLKARNDIVHEGKLVVREQAGKAIHFAVGSLLTYANAALQAHNQSQLLRWLDWPHVKSVFLQQNPGARVEMDVPTIQNVWDDFRRYWLVRYYCRFEGELTDDNKRVKFARLMAVYAKIMGLSFSMAFAVLSRSFTFSRCPFQSYFGFLRYWARSKDELCCGLDREVDYLKGRLGLDLE